MKLGGSNNGDYPQYIEMAHQDSARAAGLLVDHYWANGQAGTPAQVAAAIVGSGQVKADETVWWDVEDWSEDGVQRWTPDEVAAYSNALAEAGIPLARQGIYLNQSLANNGGYQRIGLQLWLAYYTDGAHALVRGGWRKPTFWQFTSSGTPATRTIYDANLDVNRSGENVWDVWRLQEALGIDADGDYGRVTTQAVKDFQTANDLFVDGDAGPKTLAALAAKVGP